MLVDLFVHSLKYLCLDLAASSHPPCFLTSNSNQNPEPHTIFLRDGWRQRLCRCEECCVSQTISSHSIRSERIEFH